MRIVICVIIALFSFSAFAESYRYEVRFDNVKDSRDKEKVVAILKSIAGVKTVDYKRSGEIIICVGKSLKLTPELLIEEFKSSGFEYSKVEAQDLC